MLDVLMHNDMQDILAVVVRYFGGIKLGTGGLVRAYAKAAKLGIDKAGTARFTGMSSGNR